VKGDEEQERKEGDVDPKLPEKEDEEVTHKRRRLNEEDQKSVKSDDADESEAVPVRSDLGNVSVE